MKRLEKIVHNKIIAKTALAAVSIAVIASLMSGKPVDAASYNTGDLLQDQNGLVIVWEWNRIDGEKSVKDFITESYYNPTPVLIAPYDPVYDSIAGQPVSLYADSDHMKKYDYQTPFTPSFGDSVAYKLDGGFTVSLSGRGNAYNDAFYKTIAYDRCGSLGSAFLTNNYVIDKITNNRVDNRSMLLLSDNDNQQILSGDLNSSKFYTGGNCRGCLWFTATTDRAYSDRYDGYTLPGIFTLSNPEAKEKMSAALKQESVLQEIKLRGNAEDTGFDFVSLRGGKIVGDIQKENIVTSYNVSSDFLNLYLDDVGEMQNGLYGTYLGLTSATDYQEALQQNIHFITNNGAKKFWPVQIYGQNYAKQYGGGYSISYGGSALGASGKIDDVPCGATYLAYDNGLLYGYNVFTGSYTYNETVSASFLWVEVYEDITTHTITVRPDQAMKPARDMAVAQKGMFTTEYAMFYGKEYIFTAFKGETGEISSDGRPTTVISGIRTVGGTTYEDENGGVIKTEGEILCEGNTIEIPEGAVLSVDGNFINNGKIVINGGTLIVKEGGIISQLGDTNEGCIICNQGDSGEAGQIIVMPGGKILCTSFVSAESLTNGVVAKAGSKDTEAVGKVSDITIQPGLVMNAGSSLVNYGTVCCSTVTLDSKSVIEERKGSVLRTGYCNKTGYVFYAHENDYNNLVQQVSKSVRDDIINTLTCHYSMNLAINDAEANAAILKAFDIVRAYYENFKVVNVKGEGKPIIVKEDESDVVEGFGDEVTIKTTEY